MLLVLALQLVLGLLLNAALDRAGAVLLRPLPAPALAVAAGNLLAFWLVLWLAARHGGFALREVLPLRRVAPALALPMAATVVGAQLLLVEANVALQRALPPPARCRSHSGGAADPGGAWALVFVAAVVAPITEEPLFRGLLLRGLLGRRGPWPAIGATAVLFAAMHLNPWQAPAAAALGVLFGWWTVRTGSLLPALLGHALANGFALLTVAALRAATLPRPGVSPDQAVAWQPWWYYALGAVLLAAGIATTRAILAWRRYRQLTPLPAPAGAEPEGDEARPPRAVPGRSSGPRAGAAVRVLSPLWWIVGWLAYLTVAGLLVLVATVLTGQPFGPWPTAGAYALLALAGTALLHRTQALTLSVRVIAPVLLVLLVLLSALFRPPETRARRTAAATAGTHTELTN